MESPSSKAGVTFALAGDGAGEARGAAAAAAAAAAATEEEPQAGEQVVGVRMLCEGVLELHATRPTVEAPAAMAAGAAIQPGAALAAITAADFPHVKSLQLSNRNLIKLNNLETFTSKQTTTPTLNPLAL